MGKFYNLSKHAFHARLIVVFLFFFRQVKLWDYEV